MGFQRLFTNRNRTLIVEFDENSSTKEKAHLNIVGDKRPYVKIPEQKLIISLIEFKNDFTELIDLDSFIIEGQLEKIFLETKNRIDIMKLDIIRSFRSRNKI